MFHAIPDPAAAVSEPIAAAEPTPASLAAGPWTWDDIRYFVAAARCGSTLSASRALGVSQTTVARRVDHIEQRIGRRLFERRQGGYRVTALGQDVLADAERVRLMILDFLSLFPAGQPPLAGRLRIVTEASLAATVVLPALERVRLNAPAVAWSVLIHERPADLLAGDADVRVGHGCNPHATGLRHRRLGGARDANGRGLWLSYASRHVSGALAGFVAGAVEAELAAAR